MTIRTIAIAAALLAMPAAVHAYDKPPKHPPVSSSGGNPGGSGGSSGNPTPVPEPAAIALFGAGLAGVWGVRRLRHKRRG
ncbi:PEP-CTERM sorting domain-containing protein [Sphingomonas sp.]